MIQARLDKVDCIMHNWETFGHCATEEDTKDLPKILNSKSVYKSLRLVCNNRQREYIRSSVKSGPGTAYYFNAECSSHVTTYFLMSCRGSTIRCESNRPAPAPIDHPFSNCDGFTPFGVNGGDF